MRANRRKYRPGPGWSRTDGWCVAVWLHISGGRAHLGGLAVLATGEPVYGGAWPESERLEMYVRISGGNRRRGVLAWAATVIEELQAKQDY